MALMASPRRRWTEAALCTAGLGDKISALPLCCPCSSRLPLPPVSSTCCLVVLGELFILHRVISPSPPRSLLAHASAAAAVGKWTDQKFSVYRARVAMAQTGDESAGRQHKLLKVARDDAKAGRKLVPPECPLPWGSYKALAALLDEIDKLLDSSSSSRSSHKSSSRSSHSSSSHSSSSHRSSKSKSDSSPKPNKSSRGSSGGSSGQYRRE